MTLPRASTLPGVCARAKPRSEPVAVAPPTPQPITGAGNADVFAVHERGAAEAPVVAVIPTYPPRAEALAHLLTDLAEQTRAPDEVHVILGQQFQHPGEFEGVHPINGIDHPEVPAGG